MANENWQRWTYATYAKSILADIAAAATPFPVVVEIFNTKRTAAWEAATTKAEVTVSGPSAKRTSPTRHKVFVDVFAVVSTKISTNNYGHLDAVGELVKAFDKCFLVKDYGDTGLVNVGTLNLTEEAEGIDTTHVKPAKEDTQIHSTILARYKGDF